MRFMSVYKTRLNSGVNLLNIITLDSSHFKDSRNPRIYQYMWLNIDQSFVVCIKTKYFAIMNHTKISKIVGNFTLYHVYYIGSCFINK
jgi:hypothetical protein